jgi:hypothetical protein
MNQITKPVIAGVLGTAIMSLFMLLSTTMGVPKMSPPAMLSGMLGVPTAVGWIMHFAIGATFAVGYALFVARLFKKISNVYLKGALFGLLAFVFAQVAMGVLGAIFPMPAVEGSMAMMMVGSVLGHVVFGVSVVRILG